MIYQPKGRAREYSPYALNIYSGCAHGCKYCYAPRVRFMSSEEYVIEKPRADFLKKLDRAVNKFAHLPEQVLLCFMGDPYCTLNNKLQYTRKALISLLGNKIPVAVLSKGGKRAIPDLDIFKMYGPHIKYGATLTFHSDEISAKWEPGAALPSERFATLKKFHAAGVKTWCSFEPVIDPVESLKAIKKVLPFVDEFRLGKINQYQGLDKNIDWANSFLNPALSILRTADKQIYVKHDLRLAASSVSLTSEECNCDNYLSKPF